MSLIDRVKKAIPTASDPEPKANLSAADFEDADTDRESDASDGETGDQTGGSSDDPEMENPSGGQQGSDADNPTSSQQGSESGETGESSENTDSGQDGEDGADGSSDSVDSDSSVDSDGQQDTDGTGGEDTDTGADADGDSDGDESQAGDEGESQSSLFDYEDEDAWSDADGDDNDDTGSDGDGEQQDSDDVTGDSDGDGGDAGNDSGEDDVGEDDAGDDLGEDTGADGDGDDDGQESDSDHESDIPGSDDGGDKDTTDSSDDEAESGDSESGDGEESDSDSGMIEPDQDSGPSTPTPPGYGEEPYEPHPDLIDSQQSQVDQEKRELEQELNQAEQELQRFLDSLDDGSDNAGGGGIGQIEFNIQPDGTTTNSRWSEAADARKRTARLLAKRLKKSRRDSWKRGRVKGQIDSRRLHAVKSKQLNIMKQRDPGNKKQYAVIVVLDRSGSMGGKDIQLAEAALTRYVLAMQDLGIEVCVIDMYRNTPRVISPFGVDLEAAKGDLTSGETGGGTPLADVIEIARKRMENTSKFPVMISVTDGLPNDEDRYLDELGKCHMPVMGITIDTSTRRRGNIERQEQFYDVHTTVSSQDELEQQLEKMTMQIPF